MTLASLVTLSGCAKDVVLPDQDLETVCGNGLLEPGEHCDIASPGCIACAVVPTWTCDKNDCFRQCGDGVVGTAGSAGACDSPRRDTECDLTGYWAIRENDTTRDAVVGAQQSSSNWFVYRLEQTDDEFVIAESLDCGIHVTGSATVDYTPASLRTMLYRNRMDSQSAHGARRGTSRRAAGGCAISLERWYKLSGAVESLLPPNFGEKPTLASLPPLPFVKDPVAGRETPIGAEDTDGDRIPGTAFSILGIASGTRNAAQRTWKEYSTKPEAPVLSAALSFEVPGAFDLQENVLRVTECGSGCALVASAAHAADNVTPHVTFSFIGKTLGGPRVADVIAGPLRKDLGDDLSTCARVRLLLSHPSPTR